MIDMNNWLALSGTTSAALPGATITPLEMGLLGPLP